MAKVSPFSMVINEYWGKLNYLDMNLFMCTQSPKSLPLSGLESFRKGLKTHLFRVHLDSA